MTKDCIPILEAALGKDLAVEDMTDAIERLEFARDSLSVRNGAESEADALRRVSNDLIREADRAKAKARLNAYKNIVIENELMDSVNNAVAAFAEKKWRPQDALYSGIKSTIVGINTVFQGSRRSIDSLAGGLDGHWFGGLQARLRKDGVLVQFNTMKSGSPLESEVVRAMKHLADRKATGKPQGSADAIKIAQALVDLQETIRLRKNDAGADIPHREGFVGVQTHDAHTMRRRGKEAWVETIAGILDWDAMDIPEARRSDFLDSAWSSLTTGVRKEKDIGPEPLAAEFKGAQNLARSISHSRLFEFKDPVDWLKYNKIYGGGSLRESLMMDVNMSSKTVATMVRYGTNPDMMLKRVIDRAANQYRDSHPDAATMLKQNRIVKNLSNDMMNATGSINIGSTSTVAIVGNWVRALKTMAALGGSVISALADVPLSATNRMYHGRSFGAAWGDAFMAPFQRMGSDDKKYFSELLGAGMETRQGSVMARFSSDDMVAGRTSWLMNHYFRLNLLGPFTDAMKSGATMMISRDLAMVSAKAFDQLDAPKQRLLTMYGIDRRQWEVIRQAVRKAEDGREYILPGDIAEVTGSAFTGLSKYQQDQLRMKASDNLFALYKDEADFASPTPGAREQSFMKGGITPDSVLGQALRSLWQFKAFSVTMAMKVGGRQFSGGSNMMLANTIASGVLVGTAIAQLKELAAGREPLDWDDPRTWTKGFLQSGAAGLYGDFLLGEYNRYGRGMLETAVGPVGGDIFAAGEMLAKTIQTPISGELDVTGRDVVSLVKGYTPYANLFYTKTAMDYLIWYQMQELLNPGYVTRMERNLKNRTGQSYWMVPSATVARGGGFK